MVIVARDPRAGMLIPAIRWVATKSTTAQFQLVCHVKPGVHASREGIAAVSDEAIQVCVAAQAKDGEANKAVREVIAEVLKVPKSDVEIAHGMKSSRKTVAIYDAFATENKSPDEGVERIRTILQKNIKTRQK